jgi:hypothetical protein
MKSLFLLFLSTTIPIITSLEVGGNFIAVTCEKIEGGFFQRSDLELKIVMEDNCKRLEYCSVNRDWDGVCK